MLNLFKIDNKKAPKLQIIHSHANSEFQSMIRYNLIDQDVDRMWTNYFVKVNEKCNKMQHFTFDHCSP